MLNYILIFLFDFLLFCTSSAENVCGDWETYKDEQCIKLISTAGLQSFFEAHKTCVANDNSKLINIHSANKQNFLVNYLFTKQAVVDNVWIGAIWKKDNSFDWEDNTSSSIYTNWAAKNPKNHSFDTCIQMYAEEEQRGKWSNEPCAKMNRVLCEKKQIWTLNKMQQIVEKLQKNNDEKQTKIEKMQTTIEKMAANLVPVGFIYIQLPKEKNPPEVWPNMIWTDVSAQYDSTFFRVAGSKTASFGSIQEEFSPYISRIKFDWCIGPSCKEGIFDSTLPRNGGWSGDILAAGLTHGTKLKYFSYLNFYTTAGEVRPRNMAVKVWKRTN